MLLHACGGFSKTLPGHSRLHKYSGASRGLQGPPGASRGLQGPPEASRGAGSSGHLPKNSLERCARRVPAKPRTLGEAEISRGMVRLD